MTRPRPDLTSFIDTLTSYMEGLDEAGITTVELSGPLPDAPDTVARPAPPRPPRPRQRPAPAPPVEKKPSDTVLPDPPAKPVLPESLPPELIWSTVERHPACKDPVPPEETKLLLITESSELEGDLLTLLTEILHAIGYTPPENTHPLTAPDALPADAARILALGNCALQAVSTSGMELSIVRGMWQSTPNGKLLSTYAPSALKDNPDGKKVAWGDLQKLLKDLHLDIPPWTRQRLKKK